MYYNGEWNSPKIVMYCQVGGALEMAKFAVESARPLIKEATHKVG